MYKTKCPACKETHTLKNGKRAGVQLYLCKACGYQFRGSKDISQSELWREYQDRKQTVAEIAESLGAGFLLSDNAAAERAAAERAAAERAVAEGVAAERAAAERAAAERAAAFIIQLSDREKDIIDSLNRGEMQKKENVQ